ncbi:hypothetical protein IFO70_11995 [Phormidium tenue FACHB-886]|nr:hypothetical protein [Phormidium tenue FACHB-886]
MALSETLSETLFGVVIALVNPVLETQPSPPSFGPKASSERSQGKIVNFATKACRSISIVYEINAIFA